MKFFFLLSLFASFICYSQKSIEYYHLIDSNRIRTHVSVLANDSMQGRNTGEIGQKKAAKYLAQEFRKLGLDSLSIGYYQSFFLSKKVKEGSLTINKTKLNYIKDFGSLNEVSLVQLKTSGIEHYSYSEFIRLKVSNQFAILISVDSPQEIDMNVVKNSGNKTVFFLIKKYDPKAFEKNTDKVFPVKEQNQHIFYVDASKILKLKKKNKIFLDIDLKGKACPSTENVIAFVPGSDSLLKNEFLVISAHYDHLGVNKKGEVYNGADDNGSGTATLLELARVFKEAQLKNQQPKRSILFICFTGEEHGLLGSDYYSKNPLVPLEKTVADLNIDMIGHKDSVLEQKQFSVYIIGSDKISLDFHNIHEAVAKRHNKLKLDYTYNDPSNRERLYYRSDHYNFAKNGIPSIFYFGGFHDNYHQVTDDIEYLNFSKIETIAELVFLTAWELAN
ncbi:MAG: M28 family peptidase [Flavobacteriia bacterium]